MKNKEDHRSFYWVQTVIGVLSAVLVSILIGWIALDMIVSKETPPDLAVNVTLVTKVKAGWLVEFEVVNVASETAAEVGIQAELSKDGETVEENSATIDYVPGQSTARGGLFFSRDPADFELEIRPTGYRKP